MMQRSECRWIIQWIFGQRIAVFSGQRLLASFYAVYVTADILRKKQKGCP